LKKLQASGASQQELTKQTAEMARLTQMYKNPFFVIIMTYIEILPVGLFVSLISAWILKRKTTQPVSAIV